MDSQASIELAVQAPGAQDMQMTQIPLHSDDDGSGCVCQEGGAGPVAESAAQAPRAEPGRPGKVIWEGSTWDACPLVCGCCAPLCCVSRRWRITDQVIDMRSGCCGSREDSLYVKRMRDISYDGSCFKRFCCCGRATIIIYSSDRTHPELHLTTFGARGIYRALRDAWQGGADRQQIDVMTD